MRTYVYANKNSLRPTRRAGESSTDDGISTAQPGSSSTTSVLQASILPIIAPMSPIPERNATEYLTRGISNSENVRQALVAFIDDLTISCRR